MDKITIEWPDFYALNLQRIPQTYSAVRDAPGLATVVMELKDQLARMEVKVDGLTGYNSQLSGFPDFHAATVTTSVPRTHAHAPNATVDNNYSTVSGRPTTWAEIMSSPRQTSAPQFVSGAPYINNHAISNGPPAQRARTLIPATLSGKRVASSTDKVRAVARKITVFAGRMEKKTSEEDMVDYLKEGGVEGCIVKKLNGTMKDGKQYNTAAFIVTVDNKYKDVIFNLNIWPEHCSLREWVFNPKPKS